MALGITIKDGFKAKITDPVSDEIIGVGEAFSWAQAKLSQLHGVGIVLETHPTCMGTSIVFSVDAKAIEVFIAPAKDDLECGVELCDGGVTENQQAAPDYRTDPAQDDAQLIDFRRFA